jgi:hypothetical protein
MMRVLLVLGRWCKRHKLVVAMLGLIAAIAFLPMFPYFPDCDQYPYAVYNIYLSDRYRPELTEGLDMHRVPYIVLGDVVLLRLRDWMDADQWILNASHKSIAALVDRKSYPWLGDPPPDRIAELAEAARDSHGFIEPTCELVRAVAIDGW